MARKLEIISNFYSSKEVVSFFQQIPLEMHVLTQELLMTSDLSREEQIIFFRVLD